MNQTTSRSSFNANRRMLMGVIVVTAAFAALLPYHPEMAVVQAAMGGALFGIGFAERLQRI